MSASGGLRHRPFAATAGVRTGSVSRELTRSFIAASRHASCDSFVFQRTLEKAEGKMAAETIGRTRREGSRLRSGGAERDSSGTNLNDSERLLSLLGGGILVAGGLKRGGLTGMAAAALGGALAERGGAGHCHVYGALGIDTSRDGGGRASLGQRVAEGAHREIDLEAVVTVGRPAAELYEFWRDPSNLPRFMTAVSSVEPQSEGVAEWTIEPRVGPGISFRAVVTDDRPNERIAWRSEDTAVVRHTGEVDFEEMPAGRGTAVRMRLHFQPSGGAIGAKIAGLFDGAVETRLRSDLGRFKQLIETGEIATTDGQPAAR